MPRLKTRKALRGGAVPYLNPAEYRYTGFESMMSDMSLYAVSCHGETTPDKRFIVVPPKTYIIFTAHSGDPAYSGIEEATTYLGYGPEESAYNYYKKMYKQIFSPRNKRNVPQLEEKLYIYEPGDVIPDYNLFFYNTSGFVFTHGLYSLPMEFISGPDAKHHTDHWGNTKYIMKKLYNKGIITLEDFNGMSQPDKMDILTKSEEELKHDTAVYDAGGIRRSAAMRKIENRCCYENPKNLLFKPPFDQELLRQQRYVLRLSYVLNTMPLQEGTTRRVFFCHFCRVSFDAYLHEQKPLLRTLSFSGKCPSSKDREVGFNITRIARSFCNLSLKVKKALLESEEGKLLVNMLLKVERMNSSCFPEPFQKTQAQIDAHYKGALRMTDLLNLLSLRKFIDKKIRKYDKDLVEIRKSTHPRKEQIMITISQLRRELLTFYEPISEFVDNYNYTIKKHFNERRYRSSLIESIYEKTNNKLTTVKINRMRDRNNDPLYLETVHTIFLENFDDDLDTDKYNTSFSEINTEMRRYVDEDAEERQTFLLIEFESKFPLMVGRKPIEAQYVYVPFSNRFPLQNGVDVNENEPVNENEENEAAQPVLHEGQLGIGGRRKTRKRRLIAKK